MKSNNNKISESDKKLDSLIYTIQERAKSIKIEEVPYANSIIKEPFERKRGAKEIMTVSNKSNTDIITIFGTYLFGAFSDDYRLVNEIKKRLDLKPNEDWFYDLNLIVNEIKKISAIEGIEVNQCGILNNIYSYVGFKINATLIQKFDGFINNEPLSVGILRNYKDTLKKAERESRNIIRNKKVEDDEQLLALAGEIFENDEKDDFRKVQAFAKGNCESIYFPEIFNDFIKTNSKFKNGEKLLLVYDLFAMVIRDRKFYTEDEFNTSKLTHRNYNAYKKNVVKNILLLK
jgi:hypothetical protein